MINKHGNLYIYSIMTVFCVGILLCTLFLNDRILSELIKENGLVESAGVVFYFFALFILVRVSLKRKEKLFPITWALLCVIFIGEETSWFQHYFNYEVPAIEQINVQNEFNIHNLEIFQGGKLTGSEVNWAEAFLKSQNLFRVGFFGYFLILPLLSRNRIVNALLERFDYRKPGSLFLSSLTIVFVVSFIFVPEASSITKKALAETREMLYAFYILLYVIFYIRPKNKFA